MPFSILCIHLSLNIYLFVCLSICLFILFFVVVVFFFFCFFSLLYPHCVENCLQHAPSRGHGAIACKPHEKIMGLSHTMIYHSLSLLETFPLVFTSKDETRSMDAHNKYLCRILFRQLRRIGKSRSFMSTDTASKLAVSLILSRLYYCNSLHAGIPDNKLNKLQRIQNHAARLVFSKSRHASATALLRTLHWLHVKAMIQYKIVCFCFQCIYQNSMPPYISDLLRPYCPSRTLRSLDTSLLTVPRFSSRPLGNGLSLFLDPLSGTHYH